jgi:hypothetical protein
MEYHFLLAGLRIALHTPAKIEISQPLQPFLTELQDETDCTIRVQVVNKLPQMSNFGTWNGLEYYDRFDDKMRIFHCTSDSRSVFAVTELLGNGNIDILVLPAYLSWFSGSSGIFNRIGLETLLLQHEGLLLHASLIEYAGCAIAFAGPSGVGKSTQAELWKTHLQADIINGDRAALRKTEQGWMAYGFPHAGTSGIYRQACAPLKAIVVLKQGTENRLQKLSAVQAFGSIYPELSIHRWDKNFTQTASDLCITLLGDTPVYLLECVPDESAVLLLKKGLGL